ncbi:hypothetical protein QYF36_014721 [Acer negundo]|nr:hypothetical protein QYF36_014721 [Acer negundo]
MSFEEGVWAVVDVSVDTIRETSSGAPTFINCRRLPSGCVVQDMPNGYSKNSLETNPFDRHDIPRHEVEKYNLSRGNMGAVKILQKLFPEPGRLQFIYADLGDAKTVHKIFAENAFDAVMHFAAVAYIGVSTLEPLRYYHNITSNSLVVLEAMAAHNVKTLIYSNRNAAQ